MNFSLVDTDSQNEILMASQEGVISNDEKN